MEVGGRSSTRVVSQIRLVPRGLLWRSGRNIGLGFKGDNPSLVISTLEALAVLLALKVFVGDESSGRDTKVQIMPTWTRQSW